MFKYFKVIYKGLGFLVNVCDKEFVFEVIFVEWIVGFIDRM